MEIWIIILLVFVISFLLWKRTRPVPLPPEKKQLRILIVDDDQVARLVLLRACARLGYVVVLDVDNGNDAWRVLQTDTSINVLITDLNIPGINGNELCSLVEHLSRKIYILMISGSPEMIEGASSAYAFLAKPVPFARLLETLAKIEINL